MAGAWLGRTISHVSSLCQKAFTSAVKESVCLVQGFNITNKEQRHTLTPVLLTAASLVDDCISQRLKTACYLGRYYVPESFPESRSHLCLLDQQ